MISVFTPRIFPIRVAFTMLEKRFHAELKAMGIKDYGPWMTNDTCDATLHTFSRPGEGVYCIMTMRPEAKKMRPDVVVGLCAHEAMHVWQALRKYIGEHEPATEQEAYFVGAITQCFFQAFQEQTKKAKKK